MANANSTTTPEQAQTAFYEIAQLSMSLKYLCGDALQSDLEDSGKLMVAAEAIANQIGWIADRCLGYDIQGGAEDWLLPRRWHTQEEA